MLVRLSPYDRAVSQMQTWVESLLLLSDSWLFSAHPAALRSHLNYKGV